MQFYLIVLLAFGLSMDAFAVSVTNGMCYRIPVSKNAILSGLAFGFAQGLMPLIGYIAGRSFSSFIGSVDHWIALILLAFIGGKMIFEALKERKSTIKCDIDKPFSYKLLGLQAIATSIDALAVGVSLGFMQVNIIFAVSLIAIITFACSFLGVLIGNRFGEFFKDKAEILGGVVLVVIGIKIFVDHVGFFS